MVKYSVYKNFSIILCVICLMAIIYSDSTYADEATDLLFIRQVNPILKEKQQEVIHINPQVNSELKMAATALIRLYQRFISSQDGPSCGFTPSCSRFGMAAVQEYGILRGILLTADRLLRCNGSQSQHYHIDPNTEKYVDPISSYAH